MKGMFMDIGDIVVRKSYNKDIKFKVVNIEIVDNVKKFILKGKSIRIIADALENDLEIVDDRFDDMISQEIREKINKVSSNKKKYKLREDLSFRDDSSKNKEKNIYKKIK